MGNKPTSFSFTLVQGCRKTPKKPRVSPMKPERLIKGKTEPCEKEENPGDLKVSSREREGKGQITGPGMF